MPVRERQERTTITWRPSTLDGDLGDPVEVEMLTSDVEEMREEWRKVNAMPTGAAKTHALLGLRLTMDIFALFPGTTIVENQDG